VTDVVEHSIVNEIPHDNTELNLQPQVTRNKTLYNTISQGVVDMCMQKDKDVDASNGYVYLTSLLMENT